MRLSFSLLVVTNLVSFSSLAEEYDYRKMAMITNTCEFTLVGNTNSPLGPGPNGDYHFVLLNEVNIFGHFYVARAFSQQRNLTHLQFKWEDVQEYKLPDQSRDFSSLRNIRKFILGPIGQTGGYLRQEPLDRFPILEFKIVSGSWAAFENGDDIYADVHFADLSKINLFLRDIFLDQFLNNILGQVPLRVPNGSRPSIREFGIEDLSKSKVMRLKLNYSGFRVVFDDIVNGSIQSFAGEVSNE